MYEDVSGATGEPGKVTVTLSGWAQIMRFSDYLKQYNLVDTGSLMSVCWCMWVTISLAPVSSLTGCGEGIVSVYNHRKNLCHSNGGQVFMRQIMTLHKCEYKVQ